MNNQVQWRKREPIPLGVVSVSILLGASGVIDFLETVWAFRNSETEVPFPIAVVSVGLPLLLAAAASAMLTGWPGSRIATLIVLPLNLFWMMTFAIGALINKERADDGEAVLLIIRITFLAFWVIGLEWYLLSREVRNYFAQFE